MRCDYDDDNSYTFDLINKLKNFKCGRGHHPHLRLLCTRAPTPQYTKINREWRVRVNLRCRCC